MLALLLTLYAKKDREGLSGIALQLAKAAVHPCCCGNKLRSTSIALIAFLP